MDSRLTLTPESQDEKMDVQIELSSSSSSNRLKWQQKMRVDFIRRQQRRLNDLIRLGHLEVGNGAFVWIDENGLLTTQDAWRISNESLEDSVPPFHAGKFSYVDVISRSFTSPHLSWGQDALGEETLIWGCLLKKLVMKELKLLPVVTHSVWKELLADLERLATAHTSPAVLVKKLEAAIAQEEDDWKYFVEYKQYCDQWDEYLDMDRADIPHTVFRIAGVDPDQIQSLAALREIDENLAEKTMNFFKMATEFYDLFSNETYPKPSPERTSLLTESADELSVILSCGKRGPIMKGLIKAVQKAREWEQD